MNDIKGKSFGYISAALGLVAGLAWNDAIKNLIDKLFPFGKNGVLAEFGYAIVVTIVVVILISYLNKFTGNSDNK